MKGSIGTSMQGIEYRPKRTGNHCSQCKFLKYQGGKIPYRCIEKHKDRYYTSIVKCNKFERKSIMTEEQRKRYSEKSSEWRKTHTRTFTIQLNKENDSDVIEFLSAKKNRQRYIIDLIRKEIQSERA